MRGFLWSVWALIVWWSVGSLAVACGGSTHASPVTTPPLRVEVEAHPTANQGRSVRLLVRELDDATTFLTDEYGAMVHLATRHDASVIADRFLRPSTTLHIELNPAPDKSVGIYVFFSSPHPTKWKVHVRGGQATVKLELLDNAVEVR